LDVADFWFPGHCPSLSFARAVCAPPAR
jgi:hypothetical protein